MPLRLEWPGSRLYKFIHSAGRSSSPIWYLRSEARVARRGEATRPGREWERERDAADLIPGSAATSMSTWPIHLLRLAETSSWSMRVDKSGRDPIERALRNTDAATSPLLLKCVSSFTWRAINNVDVCSRRYVRASSYGGLSSFGGRGERGQVTLLHAKRACFAQPKID